jgi:hypothetical protein
MSSLKHPRREVDPKYLAWVRKQCCWVCGAPPPSDPDHQASGGMGTTGPDAFALPTCRIHHGMRQDRRWAKELARWGVTEVQAWRAVAVNMLRYYCGEEGNRE